MKTKTRDQVVDFYFKSDKMTNEEFLQKFKKKKSDQRLKMLAARKKPRRRRLTMPKHKKLSKATKR